MLMHNTVKIRNNKNEKRRLSPYVIIIGISFSVIILIGG
jgi:hypothetical protein